MDKGIGRSEQMPMPFCSSLPEDTIQLDLEPKSLMLQYPNDHLLSWRSRPFQLPRTLKGRQLVKSLAHPLLAFSMNSESKVCMKNGEGIHALARNQGALFPFVPLPLSLALSLFFVFGLFFPPPRSLLTPSLLHTSYTYTLISLTLIL